MSIVWNHEKKKLADLVPLERNPRTLSEEARERLRKSIEERGFHDVIKVDTNNVILSGNVRKDILREAGIEEVNTLVPDRELTEDERKAVIIESNRTAGTFDFGILTADYDQNMLLDLGFGRGELGMLEAIDMQAPPEKDTHKLTESLDSYMDGNIRQIVLYFKADEFSDVLAKLDRIMKDRELENHTEVLMLLLDEYGQ